MLVGKAWAGVAHNDKIECECGGNGTAVYCTHTVIGSHTITKTCGTCSGSKVSTTACEHTLTSSHNYCDHYTNATVTSHLICDHSANGVEHE